MKDIIDSFIKNICDHECTQYFECSKDYAYIQIKDALPSSLLSTKTWNTKLEIQIAKIATPIINKINTIDRNRFWTLYYRLSDELIGVKCNQGKLSDNEKLACQDYILDRLIKQIKSFNLYHESPPFQETRANLIEINELYRERDEIKLEINPKELKHQNGRVNNYIKKILHTYKSKAMDGENINAIIDNALLSINTHHPKPYHKKSTKSYLEKEIIHHFNDDKNEIEIILKPLLIELLHQEKFFNFIYNHFIKSRFIDFIRIDKEPIDIPSPNSQEEYRLLEEILEDYLDLLPPETQLILKLKTGEELNNREFIKLIYHFDYQEINILSYFDPEEIWEIKLYVRNNINFSQKIKQKISHIREKLQNHSYIGKENEIKRETIIKLIFSEAMSAKEIGVIMGYHDKQIYRKIEQVKRKILNREKKILDNKKRLEPCNEV